MNINLIRVVPCKICVGLVVNVHEVQNRRGLGEGGVAIDHKKFLCTQKYIFKKTAVNLWIGEKKPMKW